MVVAKVVVLMADGFLGRWSQRKQAVREGKPLVEPPVAPAVVNQAAAADQHLAEAPRQPVPAPPPTLEDVKALNADSSFAPFVSRGVSPEVRNAAMKKLFADPHYNVMDGLDIYIEDYSLPSPMPAAMLRQMVSAKFLNLFDEDPPPTGEDAPTKNTPNDHTDLRLQPDHAAGCACPEREPERHPDPAFEPMPPRGT